MTGITLVRQLLRPKVPGIAEEAAICGKSRRNRSWRMRWTA